MRYLSVFVRDVTAEERRHLKAGLRSAEAWRVRRCQIVVASEYGAGVPGLARQVGGSEQTVRNIIHAFNTQGVACLQRASSRPHATRERVGSAGAQQLQALLHQSPRTFGHPTSLWTLELAAEVSFAQGLTPPARQPRSDPHGVGSPWGELATRQGVAYQSRSGVCPQKKPAPA